MNDLRRELAPILPEAWAEIEQEAKSTLQLTLAGRRLVDFQGPLGWSRSSIGLGRTEPLSRAPREGVQAGLRRVQPLVELRREIQLSRSELDAVARGAKDADLSPVVEAARTMAMAEDHAIFHGYPEAGIRGICEATPHDVIAIPADYADYPDVVVEALAKLRTSGVAGPYAIALGPRCYAGLTATAVGGYPVIEHVQGLVDGPLVWAPAVEGAVIVSMRGGHFELTVGRDFSLGYLEHTATTVTLYLEQSFTFRVLGPEAAVRLMYAGSQAAKA